MSMKLRIVGPERTEVLDQDVEVHDRLAILRLPVRATCSDVEETGLMAEQLKDALSVETVLVLPPDATIELLELVEDDSQ